MAAGKKVAGPDTAVDPRHSVAHDVEVVRRSENGRLMRRRRVLRRGSHGGQIHGLLDRSIYPGRGRGQYPYMVVDDSNRSQP